MQSTMEGILDELRKTPQGSKCLLSDELSTLASSHDQYRPSGKGKDASILLSLASSGHLNIGNKGEGTAVGFCRYKHECAEARFNPQAKTHAPSKRRS
jgi:hypothetical protein